jgi:hypothetical protein
VATGNISSIYLFLPLICNSHVKLTPFGKCRRAREIERGVNKENLKNVGDGKQRKCRRLHLASPESTPIQW